LLAIILLSGGWLEAKDKGDKFFKQGQIAEQKGDWDKALDLYEQALDAAPGTSAYTIAMRRARFQAGQKHVNQGQKLRADGKLEQALGEFQRALIADPSSAIAIQEIRRTQAIIQQGRDHPGANVEELNLTPIQRAREESQERIDSILSPPELKPVVRQVGPLKMNNQPPKVLYETVGKLAGVNVLFDSQYTPPQRNFNVELSNSSAEQAFDYLAVLTHTFWKPLSPNTIFVTEDNPTKHRDYDDEVVKTFYVTNATSVQEFQEIATAIRTVADIRRVFTYNAQKAMVVRGSLDAVALAEKLVHDLDKPKSEVIIDVIIMQANSERTKNLAATIASAGTAGLSMPIAFNGTSTAASTTSTTTTTTTTGTTTTPTTTPAAAGTITLSQIPHVSINQFSTSLPGGLLNMLMTDNKTKITNSPQLRASDGQKASLKIGERYPYATGSFQPGVGTVGVSPLVSTQFNYADVGVNVEITPQVHSAEELTLHIDVEVSNIAGTVSLGGISQPIIGQNKNTADIRMREGEVNILGGLSQLSDTKTLAGLPGLTDIPVLGGVLFGNTTTDKQNNQLLIALIPHIVRTPDYTAENLRGIYAGTDQTVKLYYASPREEPAGPPPAPATPPPSAGSPGATGLPVTNQAPAASQPPLPQSLSLQLAPPQPQAPPMTAPPATAPPVTAPPVTASQAGPSRLSFSPPAIQSTVSSPLTVSVQLENAADVASGSPIKVKFDPMQLRLNDIVPGELLSRDGVRVTAVKDIRNDTGEATLTVSRLPGSPGVSGSGVIATLNFVAVGKGSSRITVADSVLKNSQQENLTVTLGELPVTVQ